MKKDIGDELSKKAADAVVAKLRELQSVGVRKAELSRILGHKGRSMVSNLLSGKSSCEGAKFADMVRYIDALGLDLSDFLPRTEIPEGMELVNVYSIAGAGPGVDYRESEPIDRVLVPQEQFCRVDYALRVYGHSMEPTISDHAVVGIKTGLEFLTNRIYCVYIQYEGYAIKRIEMDYRNGEYVIHSDNPNKQTYPDLRIRSDSDQITILGRVVWVINSCEVTE